MNNVTRPRILSQSASELLPQPPRKLRMRRIASLGQGIAAALALAGLSTSTLQAATLIWDGGGASSAWSDANNWNPNVVPAANDSLFFDGNIKTTPFNDAVNFYNDIGFNPGAAAFNLTGDFVAMWGNSTIVNNSPLLQTISFVSTTAGQGGLSLFDFGGSTHTINAAAGNILIATDVTFNAPVTLVVTGAYNTTITGPIIDAGDPPNFSSLVKNGTGTLTLTAKNNFPGDTVVNAGTLLVNGSTTSQRTYVNPGGTLGGYGRVGGNVFNSGNVSPGNSIGTLTIGKNYNQSSNGTLTIEISGKRSGQYDVLAVQGAANLDGTLRLVKLGKGPRLKVGDSIKFLTADGGVNGEFSKVVNPFSTGTMVETKVVYHDDSVALEATQGSYKAFAGRNRLTFNQRATAGGLDKLAFRNNPPKVITYLNERQLRDLPGDFDRIAPDELASIFSIGMSLANVQSLNLQRRTSDLRAGSNGFSASGYHAAGSGPNYTGGLAGPTGNEGKDKKVIIPAEDNRFGVFLTGVGEWVDVDGDGNARGYDISTGGFTVGLDYKITPNLAVGINAGYAGTGADLSNGGRVFVNGGKLGVYGTYFTGGFYVDAAVNGGYNSYDTKRSALQGTARGDTDGGELNVLLGTGYDFQVGALTIGPTATFQYTLVGIDGYTETGSLAPLNIASQSAESLRTAFGFKATYDWRAGGVIIKPELRAAWQHEYGDRAYDVSSSFAGSANSGFTVRGPEIGRDSALLGAGVAVMWNERTATYVFYDGEVGRENFQSHNVSGGVRLSF